ncbi:keratin, type I cytoskeletal 19-like [Lissotriton helveticus]
MSIKRHTAFTSSSSAGFGGGSLGRDSTLGWDHQRQAGAGSGFRGGFSNGVGAGYGGGFTYGGGSHHGDLGSGSGRSSLVDNEKLTMQDLNDRLASYLNKVKTLEETNRALEEKILEYHGGPGTVTERNWKTYEDIIEPLREKIKDMVISNAQRTVELDNSRITGEDFKTKYEMELSLRKTVENDINGLKELKRQAELDYEMLAHDVTNLEEEMAHLKKTHEEELAERRNQMAGTVTVEVDSAPSVDLNHILTNMRFDYEQIMKRNKQETEAWYQNQVEAHKVEVTQTRQTVQTSKSETRELQQKCQSLHSELDALHSVKASLEAALGATEARYQEKLHGIVVMAAHMEEELAGLRGDIMQQSQDYKNLFNIKEKLEAEIATYRQLMEGNDTGVKGGNPTPPAVKNEGDITDQDLVS